MTGSSPGSPDECPPDRRLPKSARLNEGAVFVELLRGRRKTAGAIELAVRERPPVIAAPDQGAACRDAVSAGRPAAVAGARLAVVVGRKNLPRAVDRNALKRIVREAFRERRAELPSRDLLFRLRQRLGRTPPPAWKAEVSEAVRSLLSEAATMPVRASGGRR